MKPATLPRPRVRLDPEPPKKRRRRVHLSGCPGGVRCRRHRGVVVLARPGGHFQFRWKGPGGGRESASCERLGLFTAEARCAAARQKVETLREERRALKVYGGTPADAEKTIEKAIAEYVAEAATEEKAERTVASHRERLAAFQDWAQAAGIGKVGRLAGGHLREFRKHVLTLTARRRRKGEGRRSRGLMTARPLSARTKKMLLGATASFLRRYAPHLPSDAVRAAFDTRKIRIPPKDIVILRDVDEVRRTLDAALRYDRAHHTPTAAMVLGGLVAGFRGMDFDRLPWSGFDPDAKDPQSIDNGEHGVIRVPEWSEKKKARVIGLGVSPALKRLLLAMRVRPAGKEFMFGVSEDRRKFLLKQLRAMKDGVPASFSWLALRRTCQSVQFSAAASLFAGNIFHATKRMGHSLAVAEKHYAETFPGLDADATTIEGALRIEDLAEKVIAAVARPARKRPHARIA